MPQRVHAFYLVPCSVVFHLTSTQLVSDREFLGKVHENRGVKVAALVGVGVSKGTSKK